MLFCSLSLSTPNVTLTTKQTVHSNYTGRLSFLTTTNEQILKLTHSAAVSQFQGCFYMDPNPLCKELITSGVDFTTPQTQNTFEAEECQLFKQKKKKISAGLHQFFPSLKETFQNIASLYKKEKVACLSILQHLHSASHCSAASTACSVSGSVFLSL